MRLDCPPLDKYHVSHKPSVLPLPVQKRALFMMSAPLRRPTTRAPAPVQPESSQPKLKSPSNGEVIALVLILVFPVMGTFFAPETYFAPQDFSIQGASESGGGFPFGRLAFLFLLIWEGYLFFRMPQLFLVGLRKCLLPLLFLVWALVTCYFTADPGQALNRAFRILLLCVYAAYMIQRFDKPQIARYVTISGAIAVCCSIFAAVAMPQYGLTTLIGYEGAWRGATTHKNTLGAIMGIIFAFGWFARRWQVVRPKLSLFVILGSFGIVVMSRSMTSLITVILTLGLIFYLTFLTRLRTSSEKVIGLFVGAVGMVLLYVAQSAADALLKSLGRSSDLTGRTDIWQIVWDMIKANPIFGYGFNFWSIDSAERDYIWFVLGWAPPHAHSNFYDIWFELGIPGMVIMGLIVFIGLYRSLMLIFIDRSGEAVIWTVIFLTTFFKGLSETNLVDAGSGAVFWLTLAYASLSTSMAKMTARDHRNRRPRGRLFVEPRSIDVARTERQNADLAARQNEDWVGIG